MLISQSNAWQLMKYTLETSPQFAPEKKDLLWQRQTSYTEKQATSKYNILSIEKREHTHNQEVTV